ncbi:MAG: TonB-dependent receptor [Acidobacteria bacterium]|nr:TonB-dependent receptor [Acidobacteriota bacterium]
MSTSTIGYYTNNVGASIYRFSPSGTSDFESIKINQNIVVGYDKIFSPTATNTVRVSYYDPFTDFPPFGSRPELNQFGINGDDFDAPDGLPLMVFVGTGMTILGQFAIFPFDRPQDIWQIDDDFAWHWGKHELKMGGQYYHVRIGELISDNIRGTEVFLGFDGLRSGNYLSLQQNIPVSPSTFRRDYSHTNYTLYATDGFRVSNKLNLNLGLRWDYFGVPSERDGFLHNVYQADSSGNPIEDKKIADFQHLTVAQAGNCKGCLNLFRKTFTNFQPRIGIAYRPLAKIVVRIGYSLLFNPFYYEQFNPVRFNRPETISTNLFRQPFGTKPSPVNASPVQNVYSLDPGLRPSYTQSWNLSIQREITSDSSFTVAYVGTRGIHLTQLITPNLGANVAQNVRPNQGFAVVDLLTDSSFSNYHGLQVEFLRRFTGGLMLQTNYTFSKVLDTASIAHRVFGRDRLVPLDSFSTRSDYARADFDLPHVFRVNYYYELPFGSKRQWQVSNSVLSHLISDWHISGILSAQSGHPFPILSGIDSNRDGNVNDRAVFLQGSPRDLIINRGSQYLSPKVPCPSGTPQGAACTENGVIMHSNYQFGSSSGRNVVSGPKFFGFDVVLGRDFLVTEHARLQFRSEFYNVLNHPNFFAPYPGPNQISSGVFGRSLNTRSNPREIQFALRFEF